MNFKRYHVSKNLFDPNSTRYHMGKGDRNQIAPFGNGAMFYIEAESNMTYTIKVHTTDSTFVRLYLSNAPIVENVVKSYNVISESETIMNPEVTISNTDYAYLWIQIGGAWYTEHGGSSIMLNTGSQPLPYEPYGDSWTDTPHYIHNTSTDTLTTLPAVIYPNDTTATVGLKGNMSQSSTPTPDNPIQPQETGERTENLAYGRINGVNISPAGRIEVDSVYELAIARVEAGKVYTANTYVFAFYTDEPTILSVSYNRSRNVVTAGGPSTFTAPITGYVAFRLNSGEQAMLNLGSEALPYEPYGYFIEIEVS